ncbi:uncharacterized protein B0T15DRAFT_495531 [Chaetomium strumarium]|uniref:Uncharacterized protein n=1 Tax=Chaetomium strumarium TaxID=1170767 RepID=A0AAJ0GMY5_9PEZI|nr:hypothetical protein B0T15DRAFT_495531 [Chaetomium strumarium]
MSDHATNPSASTHTDTYQAVKNRERVRKALILVHDHASALNGRGYARSAKSEFQSILIGLTDVCTMYDDAERMLIRAADGTATYELKQSAAKLAASIIIAAGRQLDVLSDAIVKAQGPAFSKGE